MVNIHRSKPIGPVLDADALTLFERQWTVYQKCIDNDYISHRGAYAALHNLLKQRFGRPFAFLELACGDASQSVVALRGTAVAHYHGVDLASPALERAARNLEALDCSVELEHSDYIEAIEQRPEPADFVWIGLSLHHLLTPKKAELMRAIRRMIGATGMFATYEPTCLDGESRDGYLDRYEAHARDAFTAFTPEEFAALIKHVRDDDYPETMASWHELGRDAGFADTELIYTDDAELFRIIGFSG